MSSQNRPSAQMNDQAFNDTCNFIVKLGTTAHGYGVSSTRLESYLARVTAALGLQGGFKTVAGLPGFAKHIDEFIRLK